MYYFQIPNFDAGDYTVTAVSLQHENDTSYRSRWDFKTYAIAKAIAASANEYKSNNADADRFIAVDKGEFTGPRYDVIRVPAIGDEVSKGFNGDYYPEGKITTISTSLRRVETSTGCVFWRVRESACWRSNQTWSMVGGHINERNPSF